MPLRADLDAFYFDHRRCGDLRAGVEDRDDDQVIWIACECKATMARVIAQTDGGSSRQGLHRDRE